MWPPETGDSAKNGQGLSKSGGSNVYLVTEKRHQRCAVAAPGRDLPSSLPLSELGEKIKP